MYEHFQSILERVRVDALGQTYHWGYSDVPFNYRSCFNVRNRCLNSMRILEKSFS